ncbi:hypothetical protein EHQ23_19385 [Leptospira bourretii]|uniref:Uncharacterized protein n=2 Tax=Leptospiraceae TaxID=170 RepID=A0A4R9IQX7_9LEPT|nr:hypothetical protein EHQ23_19385 [Leptospira bourretii]TGK94329.1 hypothetical protein EHQ26_03070 [Leptospira bourretii]TGL16822.1 hypothetical protein EHQ42_10865 [Leptospira levettii]TGL38849.1 hypothetical protein EHQ45_04570 [Leptospira bourretii]
MKVNAIKPDFQVFLFGFVPNIVTRLSKRLSPGEIAAMRSPIEIPGEFIESLTYVDSIDNGSFTLTLAKGATGNIITTYAGKVRIREVLRTGELIVVTESKKTKFVGRIKTANHVSNVSGEQSYVVSGGGLEDCIQSQTLFIDFDKSGPNIVGQPAESVSNLPISKIQAALNIISEVISESKTPSGIIESLSDAAIRTLLSNGNYGGEIFWDLVEYKFDKLSYTIGFIHTVQWINNQSFGNSLSIWSLMASIAKPPLYELFFHYDQDCSLYAGETTSPIEKKSNGFGLFGSDDFTPDLPLARLVFRKTPFDKLEDDFFLPYFGISSEVPESQFNSFDLSESQEDIFSGVHVNLGIQDTITGLALNPVTYNPSLLAKFGQRVMQITMDGVGMPPELQAPGAQSGNIASLLKIQEKLYETFGTGERIFTGSFSGFYFRGLCKGQIMRLTDDDGYSDSLHKEIKQYHPNFYVTGVRVVWRPGSGTATQETMVKWGKRIENAAWEMD